MSISSNSKLREIYQTMASLFFVVIIFAAAIGFWVLLFKGAVFLSEMFIPLLINISYLVFLILLFVALPLCLIKTTRGIAAIIFMIGSYSFGITGWLVGFALTYFYFGLFWIIVGFFIFGVGVIPLGLLATGFHGQWANFWVLLLLASLYYGTRLLGAWLIALTDEDSSKNSDYIDLEAESDNVNTDNLIEQNESSTTEHTHPTSTDSVDGLVIKAKKIIRVKGSASTALFQRELHISYPTAVKIIARLEELGMVGPPDGAKPRKVMLKEKKVDKPNIDNDELVNWDTIK